MKDKNPIILCAGQNGRAVLFGCAANGPGDGSRLTPAVLSTTETVWQEWIEVGPAAAEAFDAF